ncbi:MAG: sporulation protein [Gammaproteobacteria bacterium]|nr:sporulation protein [Gammaproteobacteria bacterium]
MSLKQRLIGASVLIALAVIFVPMFLDGAGHRERVAMNMDIPPEPDFKFEEKLPSLSEMGSERLGAPERQPAFALQPRSQPQPEQQSSSSDSVLPSPKPALADKPVAKIREDVPPPPPKAKPRPVAKSDTRGWVVQVGSFKQKSNAIALRDKLIAAGYSVFEERVGSSRTPIFRVKVGPERKRDRAMALKTKLLAKQKLKGIVVSHP